MVLSMESDLDFSVKYHLFPADPVPYPGVRANNHGTAPKVFDVYDACKINYIGH